MNNLSKVISNGINYPEDSIIVVSDLREKELVKQGAKYDISVYFDGNNCQVFDKKFYPDKYKMINNTKYKLKQKARLLFK